MRLGHVSTPVLHKIPQLSDCVFEECTNCPFCPLAKQTYLPFNLSFSRATHIFDLIHVDLWGPYIYFRSNTCGFMGSLYS